MVNCWTVMLVAGAEGYDACNARSAVAPVHEELVFLEGHIAGCEGTRNGKAGHHGIEISPRRATIVRDLPLQGGSSESAREHEGGIRKAVAAKRDAVAGLEDSRKRDLPLVILVVTPRD